MKLYILIILAILVLVALIIAYLNYMKIYKLSVQNSKNLHDIGAMHSILTAGQKEYMDPNCVGDGIGVGHLQRSEESEGGPSDDCGMGLGFDPREMMASASGYPIPEFERIEEDMNAPVTINDANESDTDTDTDTDSDSDSDSDGDDNVTNEVVTKVEVDTSDEDEEGHFKIPEGMMFSLPTKVVPLEKTITLNPVTDKVTEKVKPKKVVKNTPSDPAKNHDVGFEKLSDNNGKWYIVIEAKNGVKRWKKK